MAAELTMTPERLLLRAIFLSMKPKQQASVRAMMEDALHLDNVVRLRTPTDPAERRRVAADAVKIILGQSI